MVGKHVGHFLQKPSEMSYIFRFFPIGKYSKPIERTDKDAARKEKTE